MPRHKDVEWNLPVGTPKSSGSHSHSWESIHAALLMDIRDELKRINQVLHCWNFLDLPRQVNLIRRNTTRRKRKATRK